MIVEIGHFFLITAAVVAVMQVVLLFCASRRFTVTDTMRIVRCADIQCLCITIALCVLIAAFIANDFSVQYVAANSNHALPLFYRITAVWGAHEGSLVLWVWLISVWTVVFARCADRSLGTRIPITVGILGGINIGFLVFLLLTSNPFTRLSVPPFDGVELNPLLQDPGLAWHPPLLYAGYVGTAVACALALSVLCSGLCDAAWRRAARFWTATAWVFLTIGITIGSFWAYYELGWGGWWFWDPVENASFMPWLAATALLHLLIGATRAPVFDKWCVLLAIATFLLSVLGTFLVRSGILTSVHSFAASPTRGLFLLGLLAFFFTVACTVFFTRSRLLPTASVRFSWYSRESAVAIGSICMLGACVAVLLGTLYPIIVQTLSLGRISVGAPYFDRVFIPLMVPVVVLMGIGPFLSMNTHTHTRAETKRLVFLAGITIVVAGSVWSVWNDIALAFGMGIAAWLAFALLSGCIMHRARGGKYTGSFIGMQTAHFGMVLFIVGATATVQLGSERDIGLRVGETTSFAGRAITLSEIAQQKGANYIADTATVHITALEGEGERIILLPEKRRYATGLPLAETAIDSRISGDTYIAMGERLTDGYSFRLYHKPLIRWIWVGSLCMALGGLLAVCAKRRRNDL